MSCLSDKSGCELIYLASSFALALSQGLDADEIGLLASFVTAVGDNLAIIATQCDLKKSSDSDDIFVN